MILASSAKPRPVLVKSAPDMGTGTQGRRDYRMPSSAVSALAMRAGTGIVLAEASCCRAEASALLQHPVSDREDMRQSKPYALSYR